MEYFPTEFITLQDQSDTSFEKNKTVSDGMHRLYQRGTFKLVWREDANRDACILSGRLVLAINHDAHWKVKYKARSETGRLPSKIKNFLVPNLSTFLLPSLWISSAISLALDYDGWTTDIREAYLQPSNSLLPLKIHHESDLIVRAQS